jgi:nucleoside phosphorylase
VPDAPDAPVAGGNASADPTARIDVVIITALPVEEAAMVMAIGTCSIHRWRGRDLHVGEVGGLRALVFPLDGMGNVGAAQAAERAVGIWSPALLLLVGIAGGARGGVDNLRLGDVLVPDQVVGYELAKVTPDATVPRYQVYRPHPDLLAAARSVIPSEWALALVTPRPDGETGRIIPRAHFGPVLSGEKVLAENQVVENLRSAWPKAIGVEMESLGAALAAYQGGPGFLTVKAASDFADAEKNDDWQPYAAEAAARFAVAVLQRSSVRPDRPGRRPQAVRMDTPRTFPGRLKVYVCNRLHDSWDDVADMFDVPAHHKARFRAGNQPRDLWEWLEARNKLYELPAVLDGVGRGDLADVLRSGSP